MQTQHVRKLCIYTPLKLTYSSVTISVSNSMTWGSLYCWDVLLLQAPAAYTHTHMVHQLSCCCVPWGYSSVCVDVPVQLVAPAGTLQHYWGLQRLLFFVYGE